MEDENNDLVKKERKKQSLQTCHKQTNKQTNKENCRETKLERYPKLVDLRCQD
jgi:hypothetical protein